MKLKQCILALVAVLSSFALTGYALVTSGTLVTTEAELAEALTTGGDVTLNADIAVSTMIPIPAGVTAKLDLNGHAITSGYQSGSDSKHIYPLDVYGNLTIEDSQENGSITGRGIYVQDGSRLTIEGGAVYGIDANGGSALFQYGGDIVINGGHVEQKATGTTNFAINAKAGTVTINGGWVGGNHGAVATFGAVVVLEGGKFVCTGTAGMTDNVLYSTSNGTLTVNGGTFVADNDGPSGGCCVYDENGKTIINAGDFSNSSGGDVWGTTGTTINGGTFENLTETTHVTVGSTITNAGKTYTMTDEGLQEATIVSVTTFAELKAAVEAGKSVILANDITTTAAIVTAGVTSEIDLNGKTLTIGAGDNKFNDASNVTIKNGTIDITGLTVNGNAAFCLDEYETTLVTTVTLNDVDVVGNGYSSAYGIFYIGKSSVLNVNGGEWNLANDTFAAGGVFKADASSATLNIDGLKLTAHNVRRGVTYAATTIANSTIAFSGDADGVDAEMEHGFNRSPLAITNSTITMTDMVGRGITAQEGAVTISENSTVTMTNCQEATIDVRNGQTVTVDNTSTVTVDAEPTISSGNINGTVTVTTAGVAKIGEVEYKTFEAALAAAQPSETIMLLKDVTCSEVPVYAGAGVVNVDVNGHVFVSASKERVRNVASADGAVALNNIKFVSGFGWEMYVYPNSSIEGENFRVFPTLDEAIAYEPAALRPARIYPYENVTQDKDVVLRKYSQGTSSTICVDPEYNITWDLNGYTVLQESPTGNPLEACFRGTFVLEDNSDAKTGQWIAGACGVTDPNNSWYGNGGPAFYVLGAGNVTLKGGTISIARNTNTATNGNEIVNNGGLVRVDGGNLTLDGATLQVDDTYGVMAWGGNVTVNSGKLVMGTNGYYSVFAMKHYADASVSVNTYIDGALLIHSTASATVSENAQGVKYSADGTNYVAPTLPEGYTALQNLDGFYVIGVAPSATVTNLGERVVAAGDYSVYPNGDTTEDLNLPFVMQFTANHTKEQAASTPFGKWYGDFVVSFDGFENGGFTADGCYLAGNYGSFGWIKVPVDGMEIKNGDRFPIMLSLVNGAQTYEGICDYVKEFLCALYLTPEIVNANPNLKVTLELDVVENSDDAYEALQNGTNIYQVASYDYTASDFAAPVAKIGEVEYKTLQAAIDAAQAGETITVLRDITLTEGVTVAADDEITLNLNGMTISQEKECTASYQMIQNNGSLTITGDGKISFKDTSAGDSSFGWGSYTINNRGTLVVENGTIEHLGEQAFATHMICAIQQGAGSTTINGGLISTPNYRSVRINAGSLTINGGEFDGQVWLQPNQGDATLAVTGGTFAPNGRDASSIFMTNTGENNTVSGASISGGTFTTKIGCSDASKLAGTISGGSFSEAAVSGTNTDLLVAGYEFETEADANGYYGIEWTGNVDELVIVDGELTEFVNEQEMTIGKLTYKRTLSSESYNALYVPFEIPVDSLSDNYDVFYIYDVRSYDNDEDGTPDDWDMEVFKFNKGTLKANYPYFIRPKSTAALDMVLTLEDATLCKSEEKSVVCSSVFMTYEVKGLYHKVESGDLYGHYGISNKGRWIPIQNAVLSPFRFHLKMTNNDGSSVNVSEEALSSMRIRVIGEGSTTDIEHLKQESNRPAEIYDMQGRRVQTPAKGFYIVNGKKVYIK